LSSSHDGACPDELPGDARRAVAVILAIQAVYGLLLILRSSSLIDGVRYFALHEDAMISLRYAMNLAAGDGLVWNPGEAPVEGITNPLWTAAMSLAHGFAPRHQAAAWIQAVGLACNIASAWLAARIAGRVARGAAEPAIAAALLTAFSLPLNIWGVLGMEVGPLAALTAWATLRAMRAEDSGRGGWLCTYALLGLGTLIRIDFALPAGVLLLAAAWLQPTKRWRHLLLGGGTVAAFLAAQTAARWWYFGDILPNTYYLKMTGYPLALRVSRGLVVFVEWCWRANPILLAAAAACAALARNRVAYVPLAVFSALCAYSVWVGGDAWEWWGGANRFISVGLPLLCAAIAVAAIALTAHAARALGVSVRPACAVVTAAVLVLMNLVNGPSSIAEWALATPPVFTRQNREKIEVGKALETLTTPDAVVGVAWAGTLAYYADRPMFDLLGKSERRIGRGPMHLPPADAGIARFWYFAPGHMKWDYAWSIGELRPDVVATLWHPEEALPYLSERYESIDVAGVNVYLRKGSRRVRWDRVAMVAETAPAP
jgi:arabinofuranosyltransferase